MKKKGIICAIIASALAIAALSSCGPDEERARMWKEKVAVIDVDVGSLLDGSYEGECIMDLATAKVRVEISGGAITRIEVLKHKHGPLPRWDGSAVAERVRKAQSLEVDMVSGATGSSQVVRKAVEQALLKAMP
jgi:uncharacterized protein with FMN-binding domain